MECQPFSRLLQAQGLQRIVHVVEMTGSEKDFRKGRAHTAGFMTGNNSQIFLGFSSLHISPQCIASLQHKIPCAMALIIHDSSRNGFDSAGWAGSGEERHEPAMPAPAMTTPFDMSEGRLEKFVAWQLQCLLDKYLPSRARCAKDARAFTHPCPEACLLCISRLQVGIEEDVGWPTQTSRSRVQDSFLSTVYGLLGSRDVVIRSRKMVCLRGMSLLL
jgi:hypothetical protein